MTPLITLAARSAWKSPALSSSRRSRRNQKSADRYTGTGRNLQEPFEPNGAKD